MPSIATTEFLFVRHGYVMPGVQTIDETRRQRLAMLIDKHGSIAALNEAIGLARTDATLSQIRNKSVHSKTGTPRAMGDPMARKMEASLGLEAGWMDTPPTSSESLGEDDPRAQVMQLMNAMPPERWPVVLSVAKTMQSLPPEVAMPAARQAEPQLLDVLSKSKTVRANISPAAGKAKRVWPAPAEPFGASIPAPVVELTAAEHKHFYTTRKASKLFTPSTGSTPPAKAEQNAPLAPKH